MQADTSKLSEVREQRGSIALAPVARLSAMDWAMCRALWLAHSSSDDPLPRRGVVETHQTGFGYGPSRITLGDPRYRLRVSVSTPDVEIVLQPSCSFDGGSVAVPWLPDRC